ncbi:MAG: hypothetical protein Q9161_004714 [Pseudevernia consocians]
MGASVDITSYSHGAFKVIIVAALLIVMQILMVGGRFVSRKMRKVPLAADDYVLLIAAILTLGLCALALTFPRIAGIGAPNAIKQTEKISEGRILGQSFMAWLILHGLSIALSKCAILLLYVRVFTTSNKAFTAGVYVIGFVVIATGIANTFVAIFQCSPIAYEWNKSIQGGNYTSLIWTIWTINEPANYIIAACLPTLRPIFQRVLPSSFFILSNGSKRSTPRHKVLRRPGSEVLPSPLAEGGGGWGGRGSGRRLTRQYYFPWMTTTTGAHGSLCGECWVDVEGARGSVEDGGEQRVAVMRAPGVGVGDWGGKRRERGGGKDEVVVETMIQVNST